MNAEQDAREPALFVWPPSPLRATPIDTDAPPTREEAETELEAGSARDAPIRGRLAALRQMAMSLESDLLGVRAISFQRWAIATGWERDSADSYCWRCAGTIGPHESDGDGCADCRGKRLAWSRAIRLGRYESGLRAGIMELKFGRWRRSGREIGRELGNAIRAQLDSGGIDASEAVLVPVPMSWRRRIGRGIDHTAVLTESAARWCDVRVDRMLQRKHRRQQIGLSATARAANVRGAFVPSSQSRNIRDGVRVIILIDDVRTTGATMTAACRSARRLVGKGCAIWCCVACVADDRPEPVSSDAESHTSGVGARDASRTGEDEKFDKTFGVVS